MVTLVLAGAQSQPQAGGLLGLSSVVAGKRRKTNGRKIVEFVALDDQTLSTMITIFAMCQICDRTGNQVSWGSWIRIKACRTRPVLLKSSSEMLQMDKEKKCFNIFDRVLWNPFCILYCRGECWYLNNEIFVITIRKCGFSDWSVWKQIIYHFTLMQPLYPGKDNTTHHDITISKFSDDILSYDSNHMFLIYCPALITSSSRS